MTLLGKGKKLSQNWRFDLPMYMQQKFKPGCISNKDKNHKYPNKALKTQLSKKSNNHKRLLNVYPENSFSNFIPTLIEAPLGMPWECTLSFWSHFHDHAAGRLSGSFKIMLLLNTKSMWLTGTTHATSYNTLARRFPEQNKISQQVICSKICKY